ncbi:MAG TPA: NAD-dependent epimerase/dehydratase family protein [Solirubrobacteraceae bacterium]|nr:NAD-dependent epimerase/dehydratase family protein [Solirubrobacteraceae bacterium]
MTAAFVTGGSGFIGGALIRRLVAEGWDVHALVRSEASAQKVTALGAKAIAGDLADVPSMAVGAQYCEIAFHCAAHLGDWGTREEFERGNVQGTRNALAAARQAGLRRFVHVGTEAALLAGEPLVEVDERAPLRFDSPALYSSTKARAEEAVIEANHNGLETVVVRPRFVWGRGDTTLLPLLTEAVRSGRFAWIGGGHHRTSTTHIDNTVHGLMLAAERGAPGGVYFVTDGEPVVFRDFITRLLATQGVEAPTRSVPTRVARAVAATSEAAWRLLPLPGRPPLTRLTLWVSGLETTLDITRAREELGYAPVRTIDQGLAEMGRS